MMPNGRGRYAIRSGPCYVKDRQTTPATSAEWGGKENGRLSQLILKRPITPVRKELKNPSLTGECQRVRGHYKNTQWQRVLELGSADSGSFYRAKNSSVDIPLGWSWAL